MWLAAALMALGVGGAVYMTEDPAARVTALVVGGFITTMLVIAALTA